MKYFKTITVFFMILLFFTISSVFAEQDLEWSRIPVNDNNEKSAVITQSVDP